MKISVITVCYNSALTIERTLASMKRLKGQVKDIEYIIVDGKSTDRTNEIIKNYLTIVDKYISEPDSGMYDALNKGIRMSTGDWVMLLAADDEIIPDSLKAFAETLKPDTEIWCGSIICKDDAGYYLERSYDELEKLKDNCVLRNPASLFKKEVFEKNGYYDIDFKCNGDGELFYRMYIKGTKFQIEDIPVVIFGIGGLSTNDVTKYAIPERALIYQKYGLMTETEIAKWIKRKSKKARIKRAVRKSQLGRLIFGRRQHFLSCEELQKLGVEV